MPALVRISLKSRTKLDDPSRPFLLSSTHALQLEDKRMIIT